MDAQILERSSNGGEVMSTAQKILLEKYPLGKPPNRTTLMTDPCGMVNPIIFEGLDADSICSASLHTTNAAGPSGLDANAWCHLCCCFKSASAALCSTLAAMGHRICIEPVHADGLTAFVACHFIPLNKQPGVRLIGIGEVPCCIISKAMVHLVNMDICKACGAFQVCAGCEGGCEAAVHAMR